MNLELWNDSYKMGQQNIAKGSFIYWDGGNSNSPRGKKCPQLYIILQY
jgi:hypothetical protein